MFETFAAIATAHGRCHGAEMPNAPAVTDAPELLDYHADAITLSGALSSSVAILAAIYRQAREAEGIGADYARGLTTEQMTDRLAEACMALRCIRENLALAIYDHGGPEVLAALEQEFVAGQPGRVNL